MLSDILYRDINRQIVKRIRENNNRAYGRTGNSGNLGVDKPAGPGGDNPGGNGDTCGCNEELTCKSFNDFDYTLIYNDEEDLIAFTSHDLAVRWDLLRDDDEDLIAVYVHSKRLDAYIGLVYEFFDLREHLTWADPLDIFDKSAVPGDKGKLVEVILLNCATYAYPQKFEVLPKKHTFNPGEIFKYRGLLLWDSGLTTDVSDECLWVVDGPNTVITIATDRGTVTAGNEGGLFDLTATYSTVIKDESFMLDDTVIVEVVIKPTHLEVTPDYQKKEVGVGANYIATLYFNNGTSEIVTMEALWGIATGASITQGFALSGNVGVYALQASVTRGAQTFTDGAIYETEFIRRIKGFEVRPKLQVRDFDETAEYRAFLLYNDNTEEDVTNDCGWIIDSPAVSGGALGVFKSPEVGSFTLTATYASDITYSDNAVLQVKNEVGHRYDYLIRIKFTNVHVFGCAWINGAGTQVMLHEYNGQGSMVGDGTLNAIWVDTTTGMTGGDSISGEAIYSMIGKVNGATKLRLGFRTHDACTRRQEIAISVEKKDGTIVYQDAMQSELNGGNGETRYLVRRSGAGTTGINDYTQVYELNLTTNPITVTKLNPFVNAVFDSSPSNA